MDVSVPSEIQYPGSCGTKSIMVMIFKVILGVDDGDISVKILNSGHSRGDAQTAAVDPEPDIKQHE